MRNNMSLLPSWHSERYGEDFYHVVNAISWVAATCLEFSGLEFLLTSASQLLICIMIGAFLLTRINIFFYCFTVANLKISCTELKALVFCCRWSLLSWEVPWPDSPGATNIGQAHESKVSQKQGVEPKFPYNEQGKIGRRVDHSIEVMFSIHALAFILLILA